MSVPTIVAACDEFLAFLRTIEANVPTFLWVHLILDHCPTHGHVNVKNWLTSHPWIGGQDAEFGRTKPQVCGCMNESFAVAVPLAALCGPSRNLGMRRDVASRGTGRQRIVGLCLIASSWNGYVVRRFLPRHAGDAGGLLVGEVAGCRAPTKKGLQYAWRVPQSGQYRCHGVDDGWLACRRGRFFQSR